MAHAKRPYCPRFPDKRYHATEASALAHIDSLERAGKGSPEDTAYPCGGHWHVGHNVVKFKKRIRAALGSGISTSKTAGRRH